jgi:hypothetical protein
VHRTHQADGLVIGRSEQEVPELVRDRAAQHAAEELMAHQ